MAGIEGPGGFRRGRGDVVGEWLGDGGDAGPGDEGERPGWRVGGLGVSGGLGQGPDSVWGRGGELGQGPDAVPEWGGELGQGPDAVPEWGGGLGQGPDAVPEWGGGLGQGRDAVSGRGDELGPGRDATSERSGGPRQGSGALLGRGGSESYVERRDDSGADGGEEGAVKGARTRARLPDGVELSIYRIVQEALTNVVKHAAPARCRVSVVADRREVRIEVVDDGPGRRTLPAVGTGHGLVGMRERVMMYGGVFEAGRLPGKGFRVFARLPYEEAA
ncbi:hypothetical protein ETD85_08870 [Nonomuraea zeae]|uniref:histidine kinase n=1 Tax=Nonomuraea zeae TaxID=1642303 RepID=A0A5S4GX99_9ACTN|nr:hypothetical protein ETD85_08870 [Nonomuraea zeae]